MLTATRSIEVREARWDEIEEATWTIPAERMKKGREHRVPLAPRALAVLAEVRAFDDGSGLVFPSLRSGPQSNGSLSRFVKQLGIKAVPHGFRSSFRDWAAECSAAPREVCELALAHVNGQSDRSGLSQERSVRSAPPADGGLGGVSGSLKLWWCYIQGDVPPPRNPTLVFFVSHRCNLNFRPLFPLLHPHSVHTFRLRSRSCVWNGWQRGHNARYPALQEVFFFHVTRVGCIAQVVDRLRLNRPLGGSPGSDFFLFADAFGGSDPRFDLDGSGSVDFADFFLLADYFADPAQGKLLALALCPLLANTGLDEGDEVRLFGNPLSEEARTEQIPALEARGVTVTYLIPQLAHPVLCEGSPP